MQADVDGNGGSTRYDVVIVGGGPAGCSAGIFAARYGLDTAVFDRGRSSIKRCAHLENYLGFPAGIDVERLYGLMHDHAEEAGCAVVSDMVESVEPSEGGIGFVVQPQEGERVAARRIVAATRYDGEYLRELDDDGAMFESHEHGDEEHEHFDRSYPEPDGSTPVDGLYVASPTDVADHQAIMAAGRGARVGLTVVADARRDEGLPDEFADHHDWLRREAELTDEWAERDRWREWFEDRLPEDHDADDERRIELREREVDRRFETYVPDGDIERRAVEGQRRLLQHIDDDLVLEAARRIEARRGTSEVSD